MSNPKIINSQSAAQKATGSVFIVDKCTFKYGEQVDFADVSIAEDKLQNWPMLYILSNKSMAYVGQTTSVSTRMSQHKANEERKDFDTCNVIFNDQFNSSVITNYEHRLICSMQADGKYKLTNKNEGMTASNYFSKKEYDAMFEDLWENLQQWELADHSLDEIEESELFKYSPFKSLTPDQRVALDKIREQIESGVIKSKPIIVQGMPGTGKTILAIYLLKALKDNPDYKNLNIKLVEPVTALRKSLQLSLKGVSGITKKDIIGPSDVAKFTDRNNVNNKPIDIILVDESHKLKQRKNLTAFGAYDKTNAKLNLPKNATQLDWILHQANLSILFYDSLQNIGPSCIEKEIFKDRLGDSFRNSITLDTQMRVKGGKQYISFIEALLNNHRPPLPALNEYEFVIHDNFSSFLHAFNEKFKQHNLTRKLAGYAWEWKSKNDKSQSDIDIEGHHLKWNTKQENWVGLGFNDTEIANEVGCIHSIQGYDLSFAFVIIGNDLVFNENTGHIEANKSSYYDKKGKNTATQEELTQYIKNIYYVLLTRGIFGTHIYICDSKLKKYLKEVCPLKTHKNAP